MKSEGAAATRVDRLLRFVKNNRVSATVMALGIVIVALGTATDAFERIRHFVTGEAPRLRVVSVRALDTPEELRQVRRELGETNEEIDSTKHFPVVDITVMNQGSRTSLLTGLELTARRQSYSGGSLCTHFNPSWDYNVALDPERPQESLLVPLHQEIQSDRPDRFVLTVGHRGRAGSTATYVVKLVLHHDDNRSLAIEPFAVTIQLQPCARAGRPVPRVRRLHVPQADVH